MSPSGSLKVLTLCVSGWMLTACATEDFTSQMYQPNFGRMQLNDGINVDSRLLENGLYAPRYTNQNPYASNPYAPACLTADYRCANQAQQSWSAFDP
jgi:hypothetical protein